MNFNEDPRYSYYICMTQEPSTGSISAIIPALYNHTLSNLGKDFITAINSVHEYLLNYLEDGVTIHPVGLHYLHIMPRYNNMEIVYLPLDEDRIPEGVCVLPMGDYLTKIDDGPTGWVPTKHITMVNTVTASEITLLYTAKHHR